MIRTTLLTLLVVAICASVPVWAANAVNDTLQVNYYSNANTSGLPDGTVRITNPGTYNVGGVAANICAMIYVFTPDEQMAECCGCTATPNDLRTLSINTDLTKNPLTSTIPVNGVIKIVSSAPGSGGVCDPRTLAATPALRAWATHIQTLSTGGSAVTEEEFAAASLSAGEVSMLQGGCSAIVLEGSGHGICTCGTGF